MADKPLFYDNSDGSLAGNEEKNARDEFDWASIMSPDKGTKMSQEELMPEDKGSNYTEYDPFEERDRLRIKPRVGPDDQMRSGKDHSDAGQYGVNITSPARIINDQTVIYGQPLLRACPPIEKHKERALVLNMIKDRLEGVPKTFDVNDTASTQKFLKTVKDDCKIVFSFAGFYKEFMRRSEGPLKARLRVFWSSTNISKLMEDSYGADGRRIIGLQNHLDLYDRDCLRSTQAGDSQVEPPDYSAVWGELEKLFRRGMLQTWVEAHGSVFINPKFSQGSLEVQPWVAQAFHPVMMVWEASELAKLNLDVLS